MPRIVTVTMNPAIDKYASVKHVTPERKLRCSRAAHDPGGGGINVSRAIKKLGGNSLAVYLAGGPTGRMLARLLDREHIEHENIEIEQWTRENFTVYEETSERQFRFGMAGPEVDDKAWRGCLSRLLEIEPRPDFIVASGSLPPGVPADYYGQVAAAVKASSIKMVLDTSGEAFSRALAEGVFLIKPNLKELSDFAGEEVRDEEKQALVAHRLIEEGQSEVVVISLGAGGALLVWRDGTERIYAPTVSIRSKVGAGDSMVAGIMTMLIRGGDLKEAATYGVAAGAAAVMTPGTALCTREDTDRLYDCMKARHSGTSGKGCENVPRNG